MLQVRVDTIIRTTVEHLYFCKYLSHGYIVYPQLQDFLVSLLFQKRCSTIDRRMVEACLILRTRFYIGFLMSQAVSVGNAMLHNCSCIELV